MRTRLIIAATLATATVTTLLPTPAGAAIKVDSTAKTRGVCTVTYTGTDSQAFNDLADTMVKRYKPSFTYFETVLKSATRKSTVSKAHVYALAKHYAGVPMTGTEKDLYAEIKDKVKQILDPKVEKHLKERGKDALLYGLWKKFRAQGGYTLSRAQIPAIIKDIPGFFTGYDKEAWSRLYWVQDEPSTFQYVHQIWNFPYMVLPSHEFDAYMSSFDDYQDSLQKLKERGREAYNKALPLVCHEVFYETNVSHVKDPPDTSKPAIVAGIISILALVGLLGAGIAGMIPGIPGVIMR